MTRKEHLLICLAEECAEVQHTISKILRFGEIHPWPGKGTTNIEVLTDELNDVFAVVSMLADEGVHLPLTAEKQVAKQQKVKNFMNLSKQLGLIK